VSIHAGLILRNYAGGILNDTGCRKSPINHAVTAVGYGSEGSQNYLIVRNSWTAEWGEDGYFRIDTVNNSTSTQADIGICGILSDSRYVIADV